jgi:prepilin-type N-terminal cleavage/methylation domain-containing protein
MPESRRSAAPRGFTLIELLIVVLIIGVLATLVVPRYRQSVLKSQGADVIARIEAINVGVKLYETDRDTVPTGTGTPGVAPAWLVPYLTGNHFYGPGDVTFQFVKTSTSTHPTLVIAAGSAQENQILLAAAGSLGPIATTIGGGQSIIVQLTE